MSLRGGRKSSPSLYKSLSGRGPAPSLGVRSTVATPCKPPRVLLPPPTPPRCRVPRLEPDHWGVDPGPRGEDPPGGGPSSCQVPRGRSPALAMAPRDSPSAGRGGPGGAAQAHSPMGGSTPGKSGQSQRRARASAGCGPWGPPTAQAASWFCGPDEGRASSGHRRPWVVRAPLQAQPRAVSFPGPSGPPPPAPGPAKSTHLWGPHHARQPGGYHRGPRGRAPRLGGCWPPGAGSRWGPALWGPEIPGWFRASRAADEPPAR